MRCLVHDTCTSAAPFATRIEDAHCWYGALAGEDCKLDWRDTSPLAPMKFENPSAASPDRSIVGDLLVAIRHQIHED